MSVLATLGGTVVSLAGLGYLAATDPKRRRAFRLPEAERRSAGLAWAAVLLPGVLVLAWSGGGGFLIWFGATTVAGWGLAATSPPRAAAWRARAEAAAAAVLARVAPLAAALERAGRSVAGTVSALWPGVDRLGALERRVEELEAEVAALRRGRPGGASESVVVELARPAGRR